MTKKYRKDDIIFDKYFFKVNKKVLAVWLVIWLVITAFAVGVAFFYQKRAISRYNMIAKNGVKTTAYLYKTQCSTRRGSSNEAYYKRLAGDVEYFYVTSGGCGNPPRTIQVYYNPKFPHQYLYEHEYHQGVKSINTYLFRAVLASSLAFFGLFGYFVFLTLHLNRPDTITQNTTTQTDD